MSGPSAMSRALPAHIAIVGLGLIGGSMARGLRAAGYAGRLTGAVADAADRDRVLALGLVDACHAEVGPAIAEAQLIVLAVPPGALGPVLAEVAAHARAEAIVTDTGSSKGSVVDAARTTLSAVAWPRFVPGHPIAGTERSGIEAGFAGLFDGRRVILTPEPETAPEAVAAVERLWQTLGADIVRMSAAHHDEVLAATSHLPHVLAYTLVETLDCMAERTEIFAYAAGGFADFTRIASSDPTLWRDIVCANREPVLEVVDAFIAQLEQVRRAIDAHDAPALDAVFGRAKAARDGFMSSTENNGS